MMSPQQKYLDRVSSALEKKLREEPDWRSAATEIKAKMSENGLWAGNGEGMSSPFSLAETLVAENEALWENSRLPELLQQDWDPNSAANAVDLVDNLLI